MKVVRVTGERTCDLIAVPDPHAAGDYVVVKNLVAPMCTEYKLFSSGYKTDCLGHEAAGEVIEVAQPGKVKVGDRVVAMPLFACGKCPLCLSGDYIHCQSAGDIAATGNTTGTATYSELVLKPDWLLLPIPDDISIEHAAMACCGLGPTFGAMQRMGVNALDTVLITGMGPVGLGGVVNGVFRNARVIAVESNPYRANLARELGAIAVIDPSSENAVAQVLELTEGRGASASIDCSGVAAAQRLLINATRRRGQIAFVGEAGDLTLHISNDMIRKGLTLHGQWHYNLGDSPKIFEVIRRSTALLDKLITHTFPMSQVTDAFALQIAGQCGKVLLRPNADIANG